MPASRNEEESLTPSNIQEDNSSGPAQPPEVAKGVPEVGASFQNEHWAGSVSEINGIPTLQVARVGFVGTPAISVHVNLIDSLEEVLTKLRGESKPKAKRAARGSKVTKPTSVPDVAPDAKTDAENDPKSDDTK